jgi:exopolyphosphatase/pppGpp-phosphohydrolase
MNGRPIAVLDLGTRATKAVVADSTSLLANGFGWELFARPQGHTSAELNGIDDAMDASGELRISKLDLAKRTIFEYIRKFRAHGVARPDLVAFCTGHIRAATNREQVLAYLRAETGVSFQVLSGTDEAKWSLLSGFLSLPDLRQSPLMMIDQGGGSTEVSLGQMNERGVSVAWTRSVGIGTGSLQREVEAEAPDAPLSEAYEGLCRRVRGLLKDRLPAASGVELRAAGMGSVLREMRPSSKSRDLHGQRWTRAQLEEAVHRCAIAHSQFGRMSIRELLLEKQRLNRQRVRRNHADNAVTVLIGMPVLLEFLDHYQVEEITFNGTGLRFGVFFAKCLGLLEPAD